MKYVPLGRTGLQVSRLGFGCMRLPMKGEAEKMHVDRDLAIPMLMRALEQGVNYFDTAVGYCSGDSQRVLGEAFGNIRRKVVLSTKNPNYGESEKEWWKNLEDSLERLRTSYIDIYNHHGISWKSWDEAVRGRLSKWMIKAKEQGLIRHICCSFHDSNESLLKLVDTGYPECITLQYNLIDRRLEEGIAYAHSKGIGIVVMGPVGGGRLADASSVLGRVVPGIKRMPELALRFVLANPGVDVALSGMSTMQQLDENLMIVSAGRDFSADERKIMEDALDKMKRIADLYCTGCNYCMPCPQKVAIPRIFECYNRYRVYGLKKGAIESYYGIGTMAWDKERRADACTACGDCLKKCPQKINIPRQLKDAHKFFSRRKPS